nr:transcription factor MYB44-like isoform X2 [Ipomoea trifida]
METLSSSATAADSVTSLSFSLSGSNEAPSLINRRNHLVPIPSFPRIGIQIYYDFRYGNFSSPFNQQSPRTSTVADDAFGMIELEHNANLP